MGGEEGLELRGEALEALQWLLGVLEGAPKSVLGKLCPRRDDVGRAPISSDVVRARLCSAVQRVRDAASARSVLSSSLFGDDDWLGSARKTRGAGKPASRRLSTKRRTRNGGEGARDGDVDDLFGGELEKLMKKKLTPSARKKEEQLFEQMLPDIANDKRKRKHKPARSLAEKRTRRALPVKQDNDRADPRSDRKKEDGPLCSKAHNVSETDGRMLSGCIHPDEIPPECEYEDAEAAGGGRCEDQSTMKRGGQWMCSKHVPLPHSCKQAAVQAARESFQPSEFSICVEGIRGRAALVGEKNGVLIAFVSRHVFSNSREPSNDVTLEHVHEDGTRKVIGRSLAWVHRVQYELVEADVCIVAVNHEGDYTAKPDCMLFPDPVNYEELFAACAKQRVKLCRCNCGAYRPESEDGDDVVTFGWSGTPLYGISYHEGDDEIQGVVTSIAGFLIGACFCDCRDDLGYCVLDAQWVLGMLDDVAHGREVRAPAEMDRLMLVAALRSSEKQSGITQQSVDLGEFAFPFKMRARNLSERVIVCLSAVRVGEDYKATAETARMAIHNLEQCASGGQAAVLVLGFNRERKQGEQEDDVAREITTQFHMIRKEGLLPPRSTVGVILTAMHWKYDEEKDIGETSDTRPPYPYGAVRNAALYDSNVLHLLDGLRQRKIDFYVHLFNVDAQHCTRLYERWWDWLSQEEARRSKSIVVAGYDVGVNGDSDLLPPSFRSGAEHGYRGDLPPNQALLVWNSFLDRRLRKHLCEEGFLLYPCEANTFVKGASFVEAALKFWPSLFGLYAREGEMMLMAMMETMEKRPESEGVSMDFADSLAILSSGESLVNKDLFETLKTPSAIDQVMSCLRRSLVNTHCEDGHLQGLEYLLLLDAYWGPSDNPAKYTVDGASFDWPKRSKQKAMYTQRCALFPSCIKGRKSTVKQIRNLLSCIHVQWEVKGGIVELQITDKRKPDEEASDAARAIVESIYRFWIELRDLLANAG